MKKKFLEDLFHEKLGLVTYSVVSFIIVLILTRLLSPNEFGKYVVFSSLSIALVALMEFGVPVALVKYLPLVKEKSKTISKFISLQLVLSLIVSLIVVLFAKPLSLVLFKSPSKFFVVAATLYALLSSTTNSLKSIFIGNFDYHTWKKITITEAFSQLVLVTSLAYKFGLKGAILGAIISQIIALVIALLYLIKKRFQIKLTKIILDSKELFNLLNFNLINISKNVYYITDLLIVSIFLTPYEVGLYKIASLVVETLQQIINLRNVLAPRFSKYLKKDIKQFLLRAISLHLTVALVVIFFLFLLADKIVLFFFGEKYLESAHLIKLLSPILLIDSLSYFNLVLEMKDLPNVSVLSLWLMILQNTILDYILVPKYGLEGAAYATLISYFFAMIIPFLAYKVTFERE